MGFSPPARIAIQRRITRDMWVLGMLLLAAGGYVGWLEFLGPFTSSNRLDGTLGILLGLYICSRPAANMLDILLFMTPDIREMLGTTSLGRAWLMVNLLTILAAWAVIFTGLLRIV